MKSKGWALCSSMHVERIQNYAMRMILRKPPRTRSHPLCQMLGWTTLHHRRHLAMLGQVHRCLMNKAPAFLTTKFIINMAYNANYPSTRRKNNLHLKRPLTSVYRSTFEYQGAHHFNSLPPAVKDVRERKSFRRALVHLYRTNAISFMNFINLSFI